MTSNEECPASIRPRRFGGRAPLLLAVAIGSAAVATWAMAAETMIYTYDVRGRLIKVERSGSVNDGVVTNYTLDKADNRINVKVTGAP